MGERRRPPAVAARVHLHPDSAAPLAELERARAAGKAEVPVVAAGASRELALAADDEAALTALGQRLRRGDVQVELDHELQS